MEFDFKKCGRTLKQVSYEEQEAALRTLMRFLTKKLAGKTQYGAFSEKVLGCTAVEFFSSLAMVKVFNGNWKWKEETMLTTLLFNCAKSEMAHWVRDYNNKIKKGLLDPIQVGRFADSEKIFEQLASRGDDDMDEEARRAADEEMDLEISMGYEDVEALVKDDPVLTKYVKAVKDLNDYHPIEKRMKMTKSQREETEARLLSLIRQAKLSL